MSEQVVTTTAPGKIILHGEHAVVFGKTAIAASVGLQTTVNVKLDSQSNLIVVKFSSFNSEIQWSLDEFRKFNHDEFNAGGELNYSNDVKQKFDYLLEKVEHADSSDSVCAFLLLYFGLSHIYKEKLLLPMLVTVSSELPVGAGLGSSAAFSVALTGALFKAFQLNCDLNLISKIAYQVERVFHGRPSGIDNSICTFGGAILFRNGQIVERLDRIEHLTVMLVYTNVKRNTKHLVQSTSDRRQKYPDVINNVMSAIDSISLTAWQNFKCEFNLANCENLIEMNQHLLNCIGAGHSSIDAIVATARKHRLTAKLTGAGGGGTVVIYLNKDCTDDVIKSLEHDLDSANLPHWRVQLGAAGLSFN